MLCQDLCEYVCALYVCWSGRGKCDYTLFLTLTHTRTFSGSNIPQQRMVRIMMHVSYSRTFVAAALTTAVGFSCCCWFWRRLWHCREFSHRQNSYSFFCSIFSFLVGYPSKQSFSIEQLPSKHEQRSDWNVNIFKFKSVNIKTSSIRTELNSSFWTVSQHLFNLGLSVPMTVTHSKGDNDGVTSCQSLYSCLLY